MAHIRGVGVNNGLVRGVGARGVVYVLLRYSVLFQQGCVTIFGDLLMRLTQLPGRSSPRLTSIIPVERCSPDPIRRFT